MKNKNTEEIERETTRNAVLNAIQITQEINDRESRHGAHGFMQDIADAAMAMTRMENLRGFSWDLCELDWESACEAVANMLIDEDEEWLDADTETKEVTVIKRLVGHGRKPKK